VPVPCARMVSSGYVAQQCVDGSLLAVLGTMYTLQLHAETKRCAARRSRPRVATYVLVI
jgi:hypothetical protein